MHVKYHVMVQLPEVIIIDKNIPDIILQQVDSSPKYCNANVGQNMKSTGLLMHCNISLVNERKLFTLASNKPLQSGGGCVLSISPRWLRIQYMNPVYIPRLSLFSTNN